MAETTDYAYLEKRLRAAQFSHHLRSAVLMDEAASAIAALVRERESAREATLQQVITFLEAGARGGTENIHDAASGKIAAAALLQQASLLRDLFLSREEQS